MRRFDPANPWDDGPYGPISRVMHGESLSARESALLALLVEEGRPLDVDGEAAALLKPLCRNGRASLLRCARSLEERGLVTIEHQPGPRGRHHRIVATARRRV